MTFRGVAREGSWGARDVVSDVVRIVRNVKNVRKSHLSTLPYFNYLPK